MPTSALLSGFTGLPLLRRHRICASGGPFFSVLPEKNGEKRGAGDALYCALTRAIFWPLRGLNALFGRRIATIPMAFGSVNVPHAFAGRLHQFRSCSFPEYSANLIHALHTVGADDSVRPVCLSHTFVGADGERSRQRRRSATDAAHPLRVHIGPLVRIHRNCRF